MQSEEQILEYIKKIKEQWYRFKTQNKLANPTVFAFLVVFAAIFFILGRINTMKLTNQPRTFGDIKIWAGSPADVGSAPNPDVDKILVMEKDDTPFLTIHKNKAGQINGLYLLKSTTKEPVFFMSPLKKPGKWGRATYSQSTGTGFASGVIFMDIDFDGCFDFKMVLDDNANLVSRSIYLDGQWQQMDRANVDSMKAVREKTWYTFDPNTGFWQPEQ